MILLKYVIKYKNDKVFVIIIILLVKEVNYLFISIGYGFFSYVFFLKFVKNVLFFC